MALTPARVVARLLANVEQAGGCVVTLYSVGSHGYGQSPEDLETHVEWIATYATGGRRIP